jgi:hypothetical protein
VQFFNLSGSPKGGLCWSVGKSKLGREVWFNHYNEFVGTTLLFWLQKLCYAHGQSGLSA